jgi:hypothetical protein
MLLHFKKHDIHTQDGLLLTSHQMKTPRFVLHTSTSLPTPAPKVTELELLAQQLGMEFVFHDAGMGFGGNVILTRLPIVARYSHSLITTSGDDRVLVGVELVLSG